MHEINSKKPHFLVDNKDKIYSQNLIKKLFNLITTEEKNRFFYMKKNVLINNC